MQLDLLEGSRVGVCGDGTEDSRDGVCGDGTEDSRVGVFGDVAVGSGVGVFGDGAEGSPAVAKSVERSQPPGKGSRHCAHFPRQRRPCRPQPQKTTRPAFDSLPSHILALYVPVRLQGQPSVSSSGLPRDPTLFGVSF